MVETRALHVDSGRLRASLGEMSRVGATAGGGVSRLALTEEDREARDLLVRWMEEARLEVRVDDAGNIFGRRAGTAPELPPVVAGSHLDSVVAGGRYDGTLGVLAALEVARALDDRGVETSHPIDVASFTNEEGARFEPSMMGSGMVSGVYRREYVYDRRDGDGLRFGDELRRIGYAGARENRPGPVEAYVELHIEQGPLLEERGVEVGLVRGIVSGVWLEARVTGQADHAGPTPMHRRRDAMAAAARMIEAVRSVARSREGAVGTVGRIFADPNVYNVIPRSVRFSVDLRHPSEAVADEAAEEFQERAATIAREEGVDVEVYELWRMGATRFSPRVLSVMEEVCDELRYPYAIVESGAGHDALHMASLGETAMVFARTKGGKSHCEEEEAPWEAVEQSANVLLNAVARLAR
jgi:N-carbamoyl-L-amino-acid hydrolase